MKLMMANHEGDVTELGQMSEEAEIVAKTSLVLKWRLSSSSSCLSCLSCYHNDDRNDDDDKNKEAEIVAKTSLQ